MEKKILTCAPKMCYEVDFYDSLKQFGRAPVTRDLVYNVRTFNAVRRKFVTRVHAQIINNAFVSKRHRTTSDEKIGDPIAT